MAVPQTFNHYTYVLNNPINHTDPSGHCIPGIGDCRFTGQINWHDGREFATGVGEGVMNVVTNIVPSPEAVAAAVSNPGAVVEGVKQQATTVARGAALLQSDPAKAAAILNDNPRHASPASGKLELPGS